MFKILYGANNTYKDVTNEITTKVKDDGLFIPGDDMVRATMFGDPLFGILKHLIYMDGKGNVEVIDASESVHIYPNGSLKRCYDLRKEWWNSKGKYMDVPQVKLENLHKYISLAYGHMKFEIPEQLLALQYIEAEDVVLELGSNLGRNSMIIATILNDDKNLVTLETVDQFVHQLTVNRNKNKFNFWIENAALSKRKLIQKNWITIPSDVILPGYFEVKSISYSDLLDKYQKKFNVLVADCEGALYYILLDEPNLLEGFNKIIVENDYSNRQHYDYVKNKFIENGFTLVENKVLENERYPHLVCLEEFFQVWIKK